MRKVNMNKQQHKPCFRLRTRGEGDIAYAAAKSEWMVAMVRCGLLTLADVVEETNMWNAHHAIKKGC